MKIGLVVAGGVDPKRSVPVLRALLEQLSARHSLRVIALHQEDRFRRYELLGAEVICLGKLHGPLRRLERLWHQQQARELFADWKPDLIHALGLGSPATLARTISKRQKVPLIASLWGGEIVGLPQIGYGGQLRWVSRLEVALNLRAAKTVTLGSQFAHRIMRQWRPDAKVIPLGPDARKFDLPLPPDDGPPWRLLHVGDINRVKHQRVLLEALKALEPRLDFTLDWVGFDTLSGKMQTMTQELGLSQRVHYHGPKPWDEVVQLHRQAHLLLQSSLYESQGVAVMEAALAGVPTVGSAVGLVSDLSPDAALAVEPGNPKALAEGILQLTHQPSKLKQIGEAARAWAKAHDAQWTARTFEQIYGDLCGW